MSDGLLERLTEWSLERARTHPPPAPLAGLLLRRYLATARDDLRTAVGAALAEGLTRAAAADVPEDDETRWLVVLADARAFSDDERLDESLWQLIARQRQRWTPHAAAAGLASRMQSLEACLHASGAAAHERSRDVIPAAIDELERLVAAAYEPGRGMAPGHLRDQVASALTLLAAYAVTSRLPYAMLAEELVQVARRERWDDEIGLFSDGAPDAFVVNCEAVRLLNVLVQVSTDEEYRRTAVTAPDSRYATDAERVLRSLAARWPDQTPSDAAQFGNVLSDWMASARSWTAGERTDEGAVR